MQYLGVRMAIDVIMPKMGESITEVTILEWKKRIGDKIERDETLLEISTDKVDSEIPSPATGNVLGQTVYATSTTAMNIIIDLSSFEKGSYTVKLKNNTSTYTEKVIIE